MTARVTVVGIGDDGWDGLPELPRVAVEKADVLVGSARQLDLVPAGAARRVLLPSPLRPGLDELLAAEESLCILASGDPLQHGIGSTLARILPADRLTVLPAISSVSLACARLGWDRTRVEVVSAVAQPVEILHPAVQPRARILLLARDRHTPTAVAGLLAARGYGASEVTVLEHLGGPRERRVSGRADHWAEPPGADLCVVAVACDDGVSAALLPRVPGLRDEAFDSDGALTKHEVRAVTLAALAPGPEQLLWDVGAGSGSIAIEWMRSHPTARAIAVESRADRVERIHHNALALGVPGLQVVQGRAPRALEGLEPPDAVFIGGGTTGAGVLEACWDALGPGGRLVANSVTLESDALLTRWHAEHGGELVRVAISRAEGLGGFTAWRPMLPVTSWQVRRR